MTDSGVIRAGLPAGLLVSLRHYGMNVVLQAPRGTTGLPVGYGFALGFLVAWLYAWLLTAAWDPGVKTAVKAAIITCIVAGGWNLWVLGFSAVAAAWSLAEMTVAGVVVGKLYREPEAPPSGG